VLIDDSSSFSDQNPKDAFCIIFTLTAKVKGSATTFAMLAQASESAMNHVVGLNPQMPRGETRTRTGIALQTIHFCQRLLQESISWSEKPRSHRCSTRRSRLRGKLLNVQLPPRDLWRIVPLMVGIDDNQGFMLSPNFFSFLDQG
jgi:hypothetical protein